MLLESPGQQATSREQVDDILGLVASLNRPRCHLLSWTRVSVKGTLVDKVAARWSEAPIMAISTKALGLLSFAPQVYSIKCNHWSDAHH